MNWFYTCNFANGTQAFSSFFSIVQLSHRVLGWKLFENLQFFAKPSLSTEHLSFSQRKEGIKSIQLEDIAESHLRYIISGKGYSEPTWLVYRFFGA